MTTSRLVRRSVAVLAAAGAGAALTLIPVGSAQAAVQGQFLAVANAQANYTGSVTGGSCDLTSAVGSDQVQSPIKTLTATGSKKAAVALNATFTNSENSLDTVTVKGQYTSKVSMVKKHRDLSSMQLAGDGHLAVTHSLTSGSECSGGGLAAGETEIAFTEHHAGKLVVTRDTVKSALAVIAILNAKTGKLVTLDEFEGDQSHAVSKTNLKPGQYVILEAISGIFVGSAGVGFKTGSAPSKAALHTTLKVVFTPKK